MPGPFGCGGVTRLVPTGGKPIAEARGTSARLRIYALPPTQTPVLKQTLLLYVGLENRGNRSLRISYEDLSLGTGPGQRSALRPGDVLRPGRIGRSEQRLFASASPGVLFGRGVFSEPGARGGDLSDAPTTPDVTITGARFRPNGLWTMRNDYNAGPHLTTEGWPYFGLPQSAGSMSLFDLLLSTLPDGALLPGAAVSGFVYFPERKGLPGQPGLIGGMLPPGDLHWQVRDVITDEVLETISLPVHPTQ